MTDVELRQAIAGALKRFQIEPLADAATHLWDVLGYASNKRLVLKPNTLSNFLSMFSHGRTLNDRYAKPDDWKSVDFLFQLTDEEVRTSANQKFDFESKGAYNGTIINSYLFFAIELKGSHYSRTALAGITREVNKLFDMPALILFRHGNTLTLAIINRRLHKREAGKDVLEKVTLIQDIQLTNTHRAHIDILSDLSLGALHRRHPFSNFVGLHEAWQKTLDTSELNKRFFQDLANWYFWALPQVHFPKEAPKDADGQDSLSLIRLITRVIFCWFLKEKGLLPEALFDEHKVSALLTDLSPKGSTYYKAILQNLFFATLNQEMDKREFRRSGQNLMAHNLYRYKSLLKTPNETLRLLAEVPFMNGGLFECLDKTLGSKEKPQYIRIDGFSDRDDNVLRVPNDLFWGPERVVDLSEAYGESRFKSSKVAGLVRTFNRYKFTVAENTPIEEEVALDPELLGRVFENLLAAYNPETGATARKQTGSFYTPREIVNYMVDESLIASLKTKLAEALPKSAETEERLRHLFAYNDETHRFVESEVVELIGTIDNLTIFDPACGSGAFPMGILHKLVFVLAKLDPGNQRWKARQLAKAEEIPDATVRERVVADIEESFNANELDYGRKLYLIENCIYGVDIQPIAVQISKLRFFISLVVEQTVHPETVNRGIRPLPNLETKFVAANTLLGIKRPGQQLLRNLDIDAKEGELRRVRERHFLARTPAAKAKCREQDAALRAEIALLLTNDGWNATTARDLAGWDPYDQNCSAGFFEPEWMFGLLDGFDICIGNPPWVALIGKHGIQDNQRLKDVYVALFDGNTYMPNLYEFFIRRGLNLLNAGGRLIFIIPDRFGLNESFAPLRKRILESHAIIQIVYKWHFESVIADTMTVLIRNSKEPLTPILIKNRPNEDFIEVPAAYVVTSPKCELKGFKNLKTKLLIEKIMRLSTRLETVAKSTSGFGGKSSLIFKDRTTNSQMPVLKGSSIGRYAILDRYFFDFRPENLSGRTRDKIKLGYREKVLLRKTGDRIIAAFDDSGTFPEQSLYFLYDITPALAPKYILGLLNSQLLTWFYLNFLVTNLDSTPQLKNYDLDAMPIRVSDNQAVVVSLVDQIIAMKKSNSSAETTILERKIDDLVYMIYEVSPEEIKLVESSLSVLGGQESRGLETADDK